MGHTITWVSNAFTESMIKGSQKLERRLKELKADINMCTKILDGEMENYTNRPISVLKEYLEKCEDERERLTDIKTIISYC